jgi:predicted regulator of Ras-like GTPase activity (Roadblock/LC7/MglB family)
MKDGLMEISELVGVWGSFICNNQAEIIEDISPPGFNKSALENIARHSVELISIGSETVLDLKEAIFHFQQRKIFILDLQQAILIVLCTPSIDISLLRLTINVVATRWDEDAEVQKQFHDNYVERI